MPVGPIESTAIQTGYLTERNAIPAEGIDDHFKTFFAKANETMAEAEKMSEDFAAGRTNNIHETLLAAERANITFRLTSAIRVSKRSLGLQSESPNGKGADGAVPYHTTSPPEASLMMAWRLFVSSIESNASPIGVGPVKS